VTETSAWNEKLKPSSSCKDKAICKQVLLQTPRKVVEGSYASIETFQPMK
jgi:hypothetical protein